MTFRLVIDGDVAAAASLSRSALGIHRTASKVVVDVAGKIRQTQYDTVRRRSGATAESIIATNEHGSPLSDGDLTAVIGPTNWKSNLLERGTLHAAPFPFVGPSLDAHRGELITRMGLAVGLRAGL